MVMEIIPLGLSSFKLKGKIATVITDPFDPEMTGLKFPKDAICDIVTISHGHPDHNASHLVKGTTGEPLFFTGSGEYEAKGVEVTGVASFHDDKEGKERGKNILFRIDIDGVRLLHCGDLGHKLNETEEEQLGDIDVLFIPVGGVYTIDARIASEVVTQLEPSIVIPMHYGRPELNEKLFGQLSPVSVFLKEMGKEGVTPLPKLKVTKESLPPETQVVVLE